MRLDLETIIREDTRDIKSGLAALGGVSSIRLLKVFTRSCRNYKPLIHDKRLLQGKHQGMVIALIDVDLIVTCTELDKNTEEFTITHELVHLIRRDLPLISLPIYYKPFKQLPDSALPAIYRSHVVYYRGEESVPRIENNINIANQLDRSDELTAYTNTVSQFKTPREYITEQIASNILEYIHEQRCIMPTFAIDVFGIDEDG